LDRVETINRDLFYTTPKQACIDWLNSIDKESTVSLEDFTGNDMVEVFLIPEFENADAALAWLEINYEEWFENLLNEFWTDDDDWPQNRSWKMMNDFFDIKYQSQITDTVPQPIRKEEN